MVSRVTRVDIPNSGSHSTTSHNHGPLNPPISAYPTFTQSLNPRYTETNKLVLPWQIGALLCKLGCDTAEAISHNDGSGFQSLIIGTLRGVGGRGVGDYTSLNRPYQVLVMGIKAPYPPPPTPLKGPYDLRTLTILHHRT